jgi:hypothetical protein
MDSVLLSNILSKFAVKTPQLIGIVVGVSVFVTTIAVVLYLLYASGSFSKLWQELQGDEKGTELSSSSNRTIEKAFVCPQLQDAPLLYDELLLARKSLDHTPDPPVLEAEGDNNKVVSLKAYDHEEDRAELVKACDGKRRDKKNGEARASSPSVLVLLYSFLLFLRSRRSAFVAHSHCIRSAFVSQS